MMVVQIEKPENKLLAEWFEELRTWLDANQCQPTSFASAGRRVDRLIYRLSFEDAAQAKKFAGQFPEYAPLLRRPTRSEEDDLGAEEPSLA